MFFMKKKFSKFIPMIVIIVSLTLITGCFNSESFTEEDRVADYELTNLAGETVSLSDSEGKARLVYFFFSSCTTGCLPTTQLLSKVQEQLKEEGIFGTDAAIVSITFDPERDTTEQLAEFSGYYDADPSGWQFLRGEEAYSRELALEYGISVIDVGDGQFAHQNIITLVNPDGYFIKYYNANDIELEAGEIVNDLKDLL